MQNGSLIRAERQRGPAVWEFRWRELASNGKRTHRRIVIGSVDRLGDEAAARQAVSALCIDINAGDVRTKANITTVSELAEHYRQRELRPDTVWKTYSTKVTYEGYLNEARPRCRRGGSQIVRNTSDVRGLSQEVDHSAVGRLPIDGCQSRRSRKMAEDTLLQENRHSTRTREQSKDPKHHERALFPRNSMGMGGQEPNNQCSSKCEAPKGSGRSDARGNCGTPVRTTQPSSYDYRTRCVHRTPSWRTHRSSMGRRGLRTTPSSRSQVGRSDGGRGTENRGVAKGRTVGRANGGVPLRLAPDFSLPWSGGLGVRIACEERKTAVLARYSLALLRKASSETSRNHEACDVSHFPAHVWNSPQREWGNPKVVQELLRHASLKVTTDVYMQAVSPQKREAQSKLVKMVLKKAASK